MRQMNTLWHDWDGPVLRLAIILPTNRPGGSMEYTVTSLEGKKRAGAGFRWNKERDITNIGQVLKGTCEAWQYGAIHDVGPEFDRLAKLWLPRTPAGTPGSWV